MHLDELDAIIRISAVTTILLLAWLMLRHPRQLGLPSILFAPLALCLAGFVIGNTPSAVLRLTGVPGMWFCLSCVDKRFRPKGAILAVGLLWATLDSIEDSSARPWRIEDYPVCW